MSLGGRKNRKLPPGLPPGLRAGTALDVSRVRELTSHFVTSTAVHSKSRGWMPRVKLDLTSVLAAGGADEQTLELLMDLETIEGLIAVLEECKGAAIRDAIAGYVPNEAN
jgi:hypothetical protein